MLADGAMSVPAVGPPSSPLSREQLMLLAIALAGALLINLSGQFVVSGAAGIAGGIGATADEVSWVTTAYMMGLVSGIVFSSPLIAAFGPGRCMAAGALIFAMTAAGCAIVPPLPWMIALRSLQGFAAGGFGPIAFVATFTVARGPRLPLGLAVLALILLLPATLGPVAAGVIEDRLGWQGLFLFQAAIGSSLAAASLLLVSRTPVPPGTLRRDWAGLVLLALALAASLLVLGQGTRRYWLDSTLIVWSLAVAAGSWAGFLVALRYSPMPVVNVQLLAKRAFVVPIALNFLFRAGLAGTVFLVPQLLTLAHGYRPLELAHLFLWGVISLLIAFPLTWWLLQRVERRLVAASGLLLLGLAAWLAGDGTVLDASDQLRAVLALSGAGQVLFLVPTLIAGGTLLTAPDAPTATLAFNGTTVGGTSLGVAVATEVLTRRQAFHTEALAEAAGIFGGKADQLETLAGAGAGAYASRIADDGLAAARAASALADAVSRQAWLLSFNDTFQLVAALLIVSCAATILMRRQPPLRKSTTPME